MEKSKGYIATGKSGTGIEKVEGYLVHGKFFSTKDEAVSFELALEIVEKVQREFGWATATRDVNRTIDFITRHYHLMPKD